MNACETRLRLVEVCTSHLSLCLQSYSKDAVDHVQEELTKAQKTRTLVADVFEVSSLLIAYTFAFAQHPSDNLSAFNYKKTVKIVARIGW